MSHGHSSDGPPSGLLTAIADAIAAVQKFQQPLRELQQSLVEPALRAQEFVRRNSEYFESVKTLVQEIGDDRRIAEAGWFPHPLMPLAKWRDADLSNPDIADGLVLDYVGAHWSEINDRFLENRAFAVFGFEYKETMRQALQAHEAGLYRCVPRTLFGEIEMASRAALNDRPLTNRINAGLKPVWKLLNQFPVTSLPLGMRSGVAYILLEEQVYVDNRRSSPDARMPNRSDHIHGHDERHATERDSLNMLFLADIMFSILAVLRSSEENVETGEPSIQ